jgi:hypothetical protein
VVIVLPLVKVSLMARTPTPWLGMGWVLGVGGVVKYSL